MLKKLFIINFFFLIFTLSYAEEQKIVYLNIEKIMQNSIAGKSIKKQLENLYNKDLEKFKKNDETLKNKEKKLITQKNILSQEDFQKELTILRSEIINFQKDQVRARENINKLRREATGKLISKLSPILQEYAKKNSISLILQKKTLSWEKKKLKLLKKYFQLQIIK